MRLRWSAVVLCLVQIAFAQSEFQLKEYFEGKPVVVKLDMPASKVGVDVRAEPTPAIQFSDYAARLKRFGTSLRRGETVLVTKIKVKERNIEFQLGGGGYGTLGDDTDTSVPVSLAQKTQREKNLERDVKNEKDQAKRRQMQEELDSLRKERRRHDSMVQATAATAEAAKEDSVRRRALDGGSRFNLVFPEGVPARALTPEYVMATLREWVEFPSTAAVTQPAPELSPRSLRKGLTLDEVRAMVGAPVRSSEHSEGALLVQVHTYRMAQGRLEATFVEGVLIKYALLSE